MLRLEETPTLTIAPSDDRAPDERTSDRIIEASVEAAIEQVRAGHDPYWTLLHAGLAAELLIGGAA